MSTATIMHDGEKRPFSIERGIAALAGFMVLLSVALTYWVHPGFVWLTVLVGANLFQQAFTGFCPAAIVAARSALASASVIQSKSCRFPTRFRMWA